MAAPGLGVSLLDASGAQVGSAAAGALAVGDVSVFNTESTAALGSSSTFTGPWRDQLNQNWFGAVALTDAAGGTLVIDEADAAAPAATNLVAKAAVAATDALAPSPPAAGQQARLAPTKTLMRFVRLRFVNGATVQTRFFAYSSMSPLN